MPRWALPTTGKAKLKGAYGADSFGQQMASVAALIAGRLDTRVYYVSLGGFDRHVGQVGGDDHSGNGAHMNLLHNLSDAVAQFQYDLSVGAPIQLDSTGMNVSNRVVGMTMSEFGRRPSENASYGTDHGHAPTLRPLCNLYLGCRSLPQSSANHPISRISMRTAILRGRPIIHGLRRGAH